MTSCHRRGACDFQNLLASPPITHELGHMMKIALGTHAWPISNKKIQKKTLSIIMFPNIEKLRFRENYPAPNSS